MSRLNIYLGAALMLSTLLIANAQQPDFRSLTPLKEAEGMARQYSDTGHLTPALTLWMVEQTCTDTSYQSAIDKSKRACAESMSKISRICAAQLHRKLPKSDGQAQGERLSFPVFTVRFQDCLKSEYALRIAAEGESQ